MFAFSSQLNIQSQGMLQKFKQTLKQKHYSITYIEYLTQIITEDSKISTFQQIYELINKQSDTITQYFSSPEADSKLIQYRNPLCFESLREYFLRMIRGVNKKYGNDIEKFKQGLKGTTKELGEILAASTTRIVKNSEHLLKDSVARKIMVYSYSKSICLSLKKLHKSLQDSLQVFICKSGSLQQGVRIYQQLTIEGLNCRLIGDNQIGYYMPEMSCVLVGAEVVLDNGAILNRAGTYVVALAAYEAHRPFYVFAQSYKYIKKTYLNQRDIPQINREGKYKSISNDLTPPKYISYFCMDNGLFTPEMVSNELSKIFN